MTNQRVIDAIAETLETGVLTHPGGPNNQPRVAFVNTMFRTKGHEPKIAEGIRANNRAVAEAIVHLIETDLNCEIVPKTCVPD